MKLEDLVSPLELCKQIPEGEFKDSALEWVNVNYVTRKWAVRMRRAWTTSTSLRSQCEAHPAPTLAEILEELPTVVGSTPHKKFLVFFDTRNIDSSYQIGYAATSGTSGRDGKI